MSKIMVSLGLSKPNPKEQQRVQQRELRGIQRDLDRDKLQLDRQEKQLIQEIKKSVRAGHEDGAKKLAKQLVRIRTQRDKNAGAHAQISSVAHKTRAMQSSAALGKAMAGTTKVMAANNQTMKLPEMQKLAMDFEKQSTEMDMKEEIMNDTIDGAMEGEDDEAEGEDIMNQVLDEIGIEIGSKLSNTPRIIHGKATEAVVDDEDEMLKRLASLRS